MHVNDKIQTILNVENLNIKIKAKKFTKAQKPLIVNSSFYVIKNEIVHIQGPNGSGKTTILKSIIGQSDRQISDDGQIFYRSKLINGKKDYVNMYKTISYTDQKNGFFEFNAMDYVKNRLQNYEETNEEKIMNLFDLFGKKELLEKSISKFSGGEKKILALIAAFAREKADLFILDEPLNELDFETAKKVSDYLKKLKQTCGILIISHCRMHLDINRGYIIRKGESGGYLEELTNPPVNCAASEFSCHEESLNS